MKKSIACCYLTHNHPDIVKDILQRSVRDYAEHDIDICVYDDSDDEKTKEIVDSFKKEGHNNLHYIDAHIALHGDDKMRLVLQGYALPKEYDYIWPCKDRTCFSSDILDRLCELTEDSPDLIQIADEEQRWDVRRPITNEEYSDPVDFYRDYASFTTNWEGTVRNKKTMLDPIDWELYQAQYGVCCSFIQPISIFARLAEMESCRIKICRYEEGRYISSFSSGSGWINKTMEIWIDTWIKANFGLPGIYDPYKIEVVKSQTAKPELFGCVENMLVFFEKGIFLKEVYEKYRSMWPMLTDIKPECLEMIANDKLEDAITFTYKEFKDALSSENYFRAFEIISQERWFEKKYDEKTFNILAICFYLYKKDMLTKGVSVIFDGVRSIDDIVKRYQELAK